MTVTYVSGSLSGNQVLNGDEVIVLSGGSDDNYVVSAGGLITIQEGGNGHDGSLFTDSYNDDNSTLPIAKEVVSTGGLSVGLAVAGSEQIVDGGVAEGTMLDASLAPAGTPNTPNYVFTNSIQVVKDGGVSSGTEVHGTCAYQFAYAFAQDAEQMVNSGGLAKATVLFGTSDGGVLPGTETVYGTAYQYVDSGGTSEGTTIEADGIETVSTGGILTGNTVLDNGVYSDDAPDTATLILNGSAGSGAISFAGDGADVLVINGLVMPTNEMTGFASNVSFDLTSIPEEDVTGIIATPDQMTITTTVGNFTLNVAGADQQDFIVEKDANGGTIVVCYLAGTRILTPTGERFIEELQIGDRVVTRWSGVQSIRWIGRQSFSRRFLQANTDKAPVRIHTGALADQAPFRDLYVSPNHSMLLANDEGGEQLVLASWMINGITITQNEMPNEVHYFQLELTKHDCVIAEGTWSETYADGDNLRGQFHNAAEFHELYPDHREPDELILCAPRPERGPKLGQALRPLVSRAMMGLQLGALSGTIDLIPTPWKVEGWAHDAAHADLPVLLEVLLSDEPIGTVLACDYRSDLEQAGIGRGRCAFAFSSPTRISPDAMHTLRVRRALDGVEIKMSDACHAQIDRDFRASSRRPYATDLLDASRQIPGQAAA